MLLAVGVIPSALTVAHQPVARPQVVLGDIQA